MGFSWEDLKRQIAHDEKRERNEARLEKMKRGAFDEAWEFYEWSHNRYSAKLDESHQQLQKKIQLYQSRLQTSNKPGPKARQFLLAFYVDHMS